MLFSFDEMRKRLVDYYNKDPNSNIGKLISILHGELQKIVDTQDKIKDWRDVDKARGSTLDRIGQNVDQPRGAATDEVYRILLKSKIARNLSKSDVNTIIQVLALALNAPVSEITVQQKFADPTDPEPAALKIIKVPLEAIAAAGMSPRQFVQIVQRTVAAGVSVSAIQLSGTFKFSNRATQTVKTEYGFDSGQFGYLYTPADDYELPI